MAIPIDSIGEFAFISLRGPVEATKQEVTADTRPGVDGATLMRQGRHPRPFTLRSIVDAPSFFLARTLFVEYTQYIGAGVFPLEWSAYDISTEPGTPYVAVIDVRQVRCCSCRMAIGGINPPSLGYLEADWDLLLIES